VQPDVDEQLNITPRRQRRFSGSVTALKRAESIFDPFETD